MKTKYDRLKFIILLAALLCGIPNVVMPRETPLILSSDSDAAFNSSTGKKKMNKKKNLEDTQKDAKPLRTEEQPQDNSVLNSSGHINQEEFNSSHKLRATLMPSLMTVEGKQLSNGSKGVLNSKLYTSIRLDYIYVTDHWVFAFTTGFKKIKFENSDDRTVMAPSHKLLRNDLMIGKRLGVLVLGAGAGMEDKFFYKVMNTSFADVETRNDIKVYLWGDYSFFKYGNTSASLNVKFGMNPSENTDTYDIKTGFLYSGSLKIEHEVFSKKSLGMEIFFKNEDYKTQQLHLKSQEIGLGVSFSYDWGAD